MPLHKDYKRCITALVLTLCPLFAVHAAEPYPTKPVRLLVGFSAGGANDLVGRIVAAKLSARMNQPVVIDNRAGAGGNIAHEIAAKATPDGYTMVLASVTSLAMSPGLLGKVPYDPVADFSFVAQLVEASSLLSVHPSIAVKTLAEFVSRAKQQPGSLNVANPGTGSIAHLSFELFKTTAGIRVVNVPYKGGGPAVIDVLSGQVGSLVSVISTGVPHIKAGRLRGLAISSLARSPILPEVPTIAESGYPGFEANGWLGLAFPAKTPTAIVNRLQQEALAVMALPDLREQLQNAGLEPSVKDGAAFKRYVQAELVKWTKLIKESNVKAD